MRALTPVLIAWILLGIAPHHLHAESAEAPHVRVNYDGVDANQADAIAQAISAAREAYVRDFGFDVPETVVCSVTCGFGGFIPHMQCFPSSDEPADLSDQVRSEAAGAARTRRAPARRALARRIAEM